MLYLQGQRKNSIFSAHSTIFIAFQKFVIENFIILWRFVYSEVKISAYKKSYMYEKNCSIVKFVVFIFKKVSMIQLDVPSELLKFTSKKF